MNQQENTTRDTLPTTGPEVDSPLVDHLRGGQCPGCNSGQLVLDDYKGDTALVCGACGVPRVRVW